MYKPVLMVLLAVVSNNAFSEKTDASGPAMIPIPGRNYEIGKTEVTQAEWRTMMGTNPSHFSNCGDTCSVEQVSSGQTHLAGQKQANGYGLHNMTGNVWEWMNDCWQGDCERRALRGGSWLNFPQLAHIVPRGSYVTSNLHDNVWFRLARTLP